MRYFHPDTIMTVKYTDPPDALPPLAQVAPDVPQLDASERYYRAQMCLKLEDVLRSVHPSESWEAFTYSELLTAVARWTEGERSRVRDRGPADSGFSRRHI